MDELKLFEAHRARLRAMAYRILGSTSDADDAVQDSWIRLSRTPPDSIEDLGGWLTTVTARVCLTMLSVRARKLTLPIESHDDPVVTAAGTDPEQQALLGDAVGAALMVVLAELAPAERVAFVLHEAFAVPFEQIAAILDRSTPAVRQLASRARRRIRGAEPSEADRTHHRAVVDAFFAAARKGDFAALVGVLDPDVVLRTDQPSGLGSVTAGADQVAGRALLFAAPNRVTTAALVDGVVGVLVRIDGQLVAIMKFTVDHELITAITAFTDPDRLRRIELNAIGQ